MIKIKVFTAIVCWLLLATMVSSCGGSPAIIRTVVSETLVAQIVDAPSHDSQLTYSPDARRVAYIAEKGGKKYVVVDGVPGKKGYNALSGISLGTFSPDSKRVAYIAVTYSEKPPAGNKYFVVIDGEEGDAYNSAEFVIFSPDSKHVFYKADGLLFLDRVQVKGPAGTVTNPLFSPDSQHLVYMIEQSGKRSVVLDGIPGKQYDRIGAIAFSPDSKHLAYFANIGNVRFLVVDGREERQYETGESRIRTWVFNPASPIVFSPDSNHLAYVAGEKYGSPEHRELVVLDGKELSQHKVSIDRLVFSPDSNHLAYDADGFIFVDGIQKGVCKGGFIGIIFSPDSTRLAYADIKTGWWGNIAAGWVIVDGVKGKKYGGVSDITFSPDSKHVAYIASHGKKWSIIVDETRGRDYESYNISWLGPKRIVWDSADRFHYLVQKGNSIYLVEETLRGK